MNVLPVLKALPALMDVAIQLTRTAKEARETKASAVEELAAMERLAEQQAALVQEVVAKVEELAAEVQNLGERVEVMNRRSGLIVGLAVASASIAVTIAVLHWFAP